MIRVYDSYCYDVLGGTGRKGDVILWQLMTKVIFYKHQSLSFGKYISNSLCPKIKQDVQRTTAPSAGRDQKMPTLAECGHFIEWSASWQTASCHQIWHYCIISTISSFWPETIMENFKVPCNMQNWPSMAILSSNLLHGTVHHPTNFSPIAEMFKELER